MAIRRLPSVTLTLLLAIGFLNPAFAGVRARIDFGRGRVWLLFWSGLVRILPAVLLRPLDRLYLLRVSNLFGPRA